MATKARNQKVKEVNNSTEWKESYYFIHAADSQFRLIDDLAGGTGENWNEEIKITRHGIELINKMTPPPEFVFINGDLVNAFPELSDLKRRQIKDLNIELSKIKDAVPILLTPGNHDIGNKPTAEYIEQYKNDFGDDYYSFTISGVKYIALNSQPMFDRSHIPELYEKQMEWLKQELKSAKTSNNKYIVVFMHIPLFLKSADEPDQYFNIAKELRKQLLNDFVQAGVKTVFCGHYHRCAGGIWTSESNAEIEVVVSSALGAQLGKQQPGFCVVKVNQNKIQHKYFGLDHVPSDLNSIDFDTI